MDAFEDGLACGAAAHVCASMTVRRRTGLVGMVAGALANHG
jgi:hypothetical protein